MWPVAVSAASQRQKASVPERAASALSCPSPGCVPPGAKVKVFDHNQPAHLEAVLRSAVAEGQPRTGRPWKKIVSPDACTPSMQRIPHAGCGLCCGCSLRGWPCSPVGRLHASTRHLLTSTMFRL